MLLDVSPLRRHRDYRLVFAGQLVSAFGSFLTFVALPVQIYDLTGSSAIVGLLGTVQLVPLAATALWGGAFADAMDRRRLLLGCEVLLLGGSVAQAINASVKHPSVAGLFLVAGLMSAVTGFHTPSLQSLTPRLVDEEDLPAVSALGSLQGTTSAIAGPALAGICLATVGLPLTFALDAATYAVSLLALSAIRAMPPADHARPAGLSTILEGLRYAASAIHHGRRAAGAPGRGRVRAAAAGVLALSEGGQGGRAGDLSGARPRPRERRSRFDPWPPFPILRVVLPEGLAGNGRYEILRRLGAGANGVVYEARDRERQARVALKSLTKLDASTLYRFKREFRVLADVTHPNLVRLHDLVSERDEWFFTMELVEGTEFLDYVCGSPRRFAEGSTELARTVASPRTGSSAVPEDKRRSSRPPASGGAVDHERLRAGLRQLAAGVEALHAAGQLHRDLKPSNVLVTHQGRVVIVDFGISKDLRDRANDVTGADVVVGTPLFMAPEQAAGRELTAAADWYAVGVMLYMALTGRAPIDGGVMDVLTAKMTRVPAPPGAVVAGVPDDLNDLCVRLLAIAPAERATGADILRVLTPSSRPAATSIPESSGLVSGEFPASQEAFVGRHEVLSRLSDAFAQVERGESALAFLQGTSGMGKSAIARHFLDQLPGRAVVLAGRCFERESVPYKAFDSVIDALTRHLLHLRSAEQGELVPRDVAALVRLFPVLDRVPAIANAPRRGGAASDPQQIRKKAFVALRELFGRLGDRSPVVVFIDDLQWGDEDSAALLRELIAPPEPPRMLLLLAFRREDLAINAALASLVDPRLGLAAGRDAAVVMVDALAPAETRRLARALLGGDPDESLVERIESESGGNPFFVRELVQFVQSTSFAPTRELRLQTVLRERFDALDAGALRLLRIAAVAGRPIAQGIAFRAADLEDDARSAALAALRGGSLARAQGTRADDHIECSHDRIREAVVASLDGDALRSCHAELVRAMTEAGSADDEALLLHSHAAGMLDRACAHALAAARKAALALAFDRAAQFQRIALELMPNDDVRAAPLRVELGDALANAGRGVEAADAYLACTATASAADRLALKRRAAEELLFSGRIDRGLEVISEVLAHFGARFAREPSGDHSAVSSLPGAAVS